MLTSAMVSKQGRILFLLLTISLISLLADIPKVAAASDNTTCAYTIALHNRTPLVKAGDTVEITAFLTGYGIPERNKIFICWSSPDVLDEDDPGNFKIADFDPIGIDRLGITSRFPPPIFRDAPESPIVPYGFPSVMTEKSPGTTNLAPIVLRLNTSKHAPAGDYKVTFIFTYGNENVIQDSKEITFHILSWWEINEQMLQIIAVVIALIVLALDTVFSFLSLRKR